MSLNELIQQLKNNNREYDLDLIKKAYFFAEQKHKGQKRQSGEDYLVHCVQTAYILIQLRMDSVSIAAGLLHDTIDDTNATEEEISKLFSPEIAFLVQSASKLGKLKYRGIERQVENLRKMFLAMAKDIRVVIIKLADRMHNMRTLSALPENKQKRIALETLDIYAPLANRLGISEICGELEDLAFPYIYPKEYRWLLKNMQERYIARQAYLEKVKPIISAELKKDSIVTIEISSRAKRYYSLYKKLLRHDNNFEKIYDLVALRVIVNNIQDCYAVLGAIHNLWKPLIGRIKDYIAIPKPNGYRSIHTTVFCIDGKITEFQIRTEQMHREAEYGIASHWSYKKNSNISSFKKTYQKELAWVNQLKDWQKEFEHNDPAEFLEMLKIDFFQDRIFVYTPLGEVINLPEGSTPLDFAYAIHTEIGHRAVGAKVDNKISSFDKELKNGQMVEILTCKNNKKPNKNWLSVVKTSSARQKIRNGLRE